jgi:hypothetical protein
MTARSRLLAVSLLLLPTACVVRVPVEETIYSPCHAVGSSDWKARYERLPSADRHPVMRRMLIVEGKVTTPSPDYGVSLDLGPLEKLQPRVQQVIVRTRGPDIAPPGPATTQAVRAVFPARKRHADVRIRCGDRTFANLPGVPDVR